MGRSNRRCRHRRTRKWYINPLPNINDPVVSVPTSLHLVINNLTHVLTPFEFYPTSTTYMMPGPILLNLCDTMFITIHELGIHSRIEPSHLQPFKSTLPTLGLECRLPLTEFVTLAFFELFLTDGSYRLRLQPEAQEDRPGVNGFYFSNHVLIKVENVY